MYLYFGSIVYFIFVFATMLEKRASKGNRYFGKLSNYWNILHL